MEFNNLHADITFECIRSHFAENLTEFFARKLKSNTLKDEDFNSYWEEGRKPRLNTAREVCKYKGVSVQKYHDESKLIEWYRDKWKITRQISPQKGKQKHFCIFKFKSDAGVIWLDGDIFPFHCNFYKCDTFTIEKINCVSVKEL